MKNTKVSRKERFTETPVDFQFKLTTTDQDIEDLVSKAISGGIGDWAVITKATRVKATDKMVRPDRNSQSSCPPYTLPIEVINIDSGKEYIVTKEILLYALGKTLIDFPYALDTVAGYNIDVGKLTSEDIDEIIQLAVFGKIQYRFV